MLGSVYTSQTERGQILDCTDCSDGVQRPESVQEIGGHGTIYIGIWLLNEVSKTEKKIPALLEFIF